METMKIVRYASAGFSGWGVLEDSGVVRGLNGSPYEDAVAGDPVGHIDDLRLLAPVEPGKVIGVGLNYVEHIQEGNEITPEFPMVFMLPATAVMGPEQPIIYPRQAEHVEFEGEVVVVIGKPARHVNESKALASVLGYTCGNDVSERSIQAAEMATGVLLVGKGFDTFCPIGPVIDTNLDPDAITLVSRLNGIERQRTSTNDMLFSVGTIVSYLSQAITLLPGDIIFTGTPSGVGRIEPGDVVEVEIEGSGILRNPVERESFDIA
jgi:2-keto-4-pentenoate hydratase/2-oxohepta-3-ene-1,7-dioic acid hydratase in catechol pathway